MTKYILCETIEREISTPVTFDTMKEAQREMRSRWLTALGLTDEGIDLPYLHCKQLGYCPVLGEHSNPTVFDCDKHCPGRNNTQDIDEDESVPDNAGIYEDNAFCEDTNHDNCDWRIFKVEI